MDKLITRLFIGGSAIFYVYAAKKLKDIHEEVKYFEKESGVYVDEQTNYKNFRKFVKENKKESK